MQRPQTRPLALFVAASAVAVALTSVALAQPRRHAPSAGEPEARAAIERLINEAYIEGLYEKRDEQAVRAGFDPSFTMHVNRDGEISVTTLDDWLGRLGLNGEPNGMDAEATFLDIEITGKAAQARFELRLNGELRFVDMFGLYETPGGWKVTNKIFHHFPR